MVTKNYLQVLVPCQTHQYRQHPYQQAPWLLLPGDAHLSKTVIRKNEYKSSVKVLNCDKGVGVGDNYPDLVIREGTQLHSAVCATGVVFLGSYFLNVSIFRE